jgi:DNA-binding NtrC family response regulator
MAKEKTLLKEKTILIVDDDFIIREALKSKLSRAYRIVEAEDYNSAIRAYKDNDISLAIVDIDLRDKKTGIDLLMELKKSNSTLPVMMLSNYTDVDSIVKSMKFGAYDYIAKADLDNYDELTIKIHCCFKKELEGNIIKEFERTFDEEYPIIFTSSVMTQLIEDIKVASDDMNILIEGETGVGKTPIAKYANTLASQRIGSIRPFVRINCAGLSRERLQADLFGHKRGSFTGAVNDNKGLVELAKNGDLFLDEVADMDMQCQAELLTFLDSGEYRRLGDPVVRYSNCRIITACNTFLKEKVEQGLFRKDLYSRLSQYKIKIPALRERKQDIKPIMEYYINRFCGTAKPYAPEVLDVYLHHDWLEGNVRELRDAVKYMCMKARDSKEITPAHINGDYYCTSTPIKNIIIDKNNMKESVIEMGYDNYISNVERMILSELINQEKSVRSLSKKIKITNMTLGRKLKKYELCIE